MDREIPRTYAASGTVSVARSSVVLAIGSISAERLNLEVGGGLESWLSAVVREILISTKGASRSENATRYSIRGCDSVSVI